MLKINILILILFLTISACSNGGEGQTNDTSNPDVDITNPDVDKPKPTTTIHPVTTTEANYQHLALAVNGQDDRLVIWQANSGVGTALLGKAVLFSVHDNASSTWSDQSILVESNLVSISIKQVIANQSEFAILYQPPRETGLRVAIIKQIGGVWQLDPDASQSFLTSNIKLASDGQTFFAVWQQTVDFEYKIHYRLYKDSQWRDPVIKGNFTNARVVLLDSNDKGYFLVWQSEESTLATEFTVGMGVYDSGSESWQDEIVNTNIPRPSFNEDINVLADSSDQGFCYLWETGSPNFSRVTAQVYLYGNNGGWKAEQVVNDFNMEPDTWTNEQIQIAMAGDTCVVAWNDTDTYTLYRRQYTSSSDSWGDAEIIDSQSNYLALLSNDNEIAVKWWNESLQFQVLTNGVWNSYDISAMDDYLVAYVIGDGDQFLFLTSKLAFRFNTTDGFDEASWRHLFDANIYASFCFVESFDSCEKIVPYIDTGIAFGSDFVAFAETSDVYGDRIITSVIKDDGTTQYDVANQKFNSSGLLPSIYQNGEQKLVVWKQADKAFPIPYFSFKLYDSTQWSAPEGLVKTENLLEALGDIDVFTIQDGFLITRDVGQAIFYNQLIDGQLGQEAPLPTVASASAMIQSPDPTYCWNEVNAIGLNQSLETLYCQYHRNGDWGDQETINITDLSAVSRISNLQLMTTSNGHAIFWINRDNSDNSYLNIAWKNDQGWQVAEPELLQAPSIRMPIYPISVTDSSFLTIWEETDKPNSISWKLFNTGTQSWSVTQYNDVSNISRAQLIKVDNRVELIAISNNNLVSFPFEDEQWKGEYSLTNNDSSQILFNFDISANDNMAAIIMEYYSGVNVDVKLSYRVYNGSDWGVIHDLNIPDLGIGVYPSIHISAGSILAAGSSKDSVHPSIQNIMTIENL
jgi:hypothetical protein